jgi:hypothetical protein
MPILIAAIVILVVSSLKILYFASADAPAALLAVAGATGLILVALALYERSRLLRSGASRSRVASVTSRHMGIIWLWGALALLLVYMFALSWREWWHFCAAFATAGLLCLGFSAALARDADAGRDDETMLSLGRYLAIGQLVGMVATVVGLAIDPDKEFVFIKEGDWAGNSIFLSGALALAAVSAYALITDKNATRQAGA